MPGAKPKTCRCPTRSARRPASTRTTNGGNGDGPDDDDDDAPAPEAAGTQPAVFKPGTRSASGPRCLMPVGVALVDLRRDLRAETGQSLNPAQGVQSQATQDNQLDRQQRELWANYDWPHLRYWVDVPAVPGQNVYDYPHRNAVRPDQSDLVAADRGRRHGSRWLTASGPSTRCPSTPQQGTPLRWGNMASVANGKTDPVGQFEVLPIPNVDGTLRFDGQAPVNPLVADDDICIIDSKAIVLFAAAEILATKKVEAAQLKLLKAQTYLRRLLANQGADKRRNLQHGRQLRPRLHQRPLSARTRCRASTTSRHRPTRWRITINNFSAGLDLRRSSLTAPAGTLRTLKNLHVTPGGEIEKRYAFVKFATVDPRQRAWLRSTRSFMSLVPAVPARSSRSATGTVGTLQLDTTVIEEIVDYDLFNNKVFSIVTVDAAGTVHALL